MSQSDPIADMLTRIRNANMSKTDFVEMPHSRMKDEIARILKREGFIRDYTAEGGGTKKILRLYLKYMSGRSREAVIRGLRRISRPGLRRYVSCTSLPVVLNGTGIAIISTSKGVLCGKEARKLHIGGEWICSVW